MVRGSKTEPSDTIVVTITVTAAGTGVVTPPVDVDSLIATRYDTDGSGTINLLSEVIQAIRMTTSYGEGG